jgi:DNA-directed RNA polymerase subunit alpha
MFPENASTVDNPNLLVRWDATPLRRRVANALNDYSLCYVGDLVGRPPEYLTTIADIGAKGIQEINDLLAGMGLKLGMELPNWPPPELCKSPLLDLPNWPPTLGT